MTIANHSEKLIKLDLQLFAGDEDAILPDDYEAPPQADDFTEEVETFETDPVEEQPEPTEEVTETPEVTEQPRFKVKFNHEEQEIDYDEAVPLIQKGMNYDKLQERVQQFESDPRLALVDELAKDAGMTPDEYLDAVKQHREQQQLNELVQQNIPEELAREILETKKFREQFNSEKQTKAEEEKKNAEFNEFFHYYKQANGKDFDPNKDQIPAEVWEANQKGTPLKYAYMEHHNNQLQSQIKTIKQNEENAKRAPIGGTQQHGSSAADVEDDFMRGFNSI